MKPWKCCLVPNPGALPGNLVVGGGGEGESRTMLLTPEVGKPSSQTCQARVPTAEGAGAKIMGQGVQTEGLGSTHGAMSACVWPLSPAGDHSLSLGGLVT